MLSSISVSSIRSSRLPTSKMHRKVRNSWLPQVCVMCKCHLHRRVTNERRMLYSSLGTKSLQEILSDRESIAQTMQVDSISGLLDQNERKKPSDLSGRFGWRYRMLGRSSRTSGSVSNWEGSGRVTDRLSIDVIGRMSDYLFSFNGRSPSSMRYCSTIVALRVFRAMAAEAEAAREARAKVIAAEGEQKASRYESKDTSDNHRFLPAIICRALKDAADVIMQSPVALQLRYLQTLTTIASEKNSTIVFPIPVSIMKRPSLVVIAILFSDRIHASRHR